MLPESINLFLKNYAAGTYREDEHQQFVDWLQTASEEEMEFIADTYSGIVSNNGLISESNKQLVVQIEAALDRFEGSSTREKILPGSVFLLNRYWKVAAAVLILLTAGSYFVFLDKSRHQGHDDHAIGLTKDVAPPASTKAFITLADGSKIFLDERQNGKLATQGDVTVAINKDGSIAYHSQQNVAEKEIKFNTLTVPKGSKPENIVLADGSHVWLDAGTTIIYPTTFAGKERKIQLAGGQCYFEIAHNENMPFIVEKGVSKIEVLGTHFNVHAYNDEPMMSVTLLEGSVKVVSNASDTKGTIIKPGQQAQLTTGGVLKIEHADIDAVMAWKSGLFNFNHSDLQMVLRQLSRWYDIEVVYQGAIPERKFGGEMQRDLNLSDVLKVLEKNNVHFRIEGKRLIVLP